MLNPSSFDDDEDDDDGYLQREKKRHGIFRIGCDNLLETVGGGRWPEQSLRLAVSGPEQRVQVVCLVCTKMTP